MPEEPGMTHAASGTRPHTSWILWVLIGCVTALILTLAGFAFAGMFTAVNEEMVPFFHALAWIVPVGVDVGILALTASGLLLEWLLMPMPALRWVAMTFMGISVWLNVASAQGSIAGSIGHAALPVLFIACVEAVRHAVRRTAGMAAGTVREGIPLARWILAPLPAFLMFRRMVLQRVYSYPVAVEGELQRRRDIAALRAHCGARWKKEAPGDLVWSLRKGIALDDAHARVALLTSIPAVPAGSPVPGAAGVPATQRAPKAMGAPGTRMRHQTAPGTREGAPGGTGTRNPEPATPARRFRSLDELVREGREAEERAGRRLGVKALRTELACKYKVAQAVARILHPEDTAGGHAEAAAR